MAESNRQGSVAKRPQYHHFIPRFLLKNFAVFKNPGKIVPKKSNHKNKGPPVPSRLNLLNLEREKLEQEDVAQTFGFVDMYRDFDASQPDQYELEKRLSRLENDAAHIIAQAKRLYEAGKDEVQLQRPKKDLLRRFLWIMMYRNRTFADRYEKSMEDYDANDRKEMLAYMKLKGFTKPRDVWFQNIRAFLDVDLNQDMDKWLDEVTNRAYPSDVRWFLKNMQMSFLAFCTPQDSADEFLLTQNAYSIFEGPNTIGAWTDYHVFSPISPRMMLITRSMLLPNGFDEDEETRLELLERTKSMYVDPANAESFLKDLPISKALNNYSQVVNGKFVPLPTRMARDKHIFRFRFFPLESHHVQKINMILLQEALGTMAIVYKSSSSLRRALEYFLASESPGFKKVYRASPHNLSVSARAFIDSRELNQRQDELQYLHFLERVAKDLGSSVTAKMDIIDLEGFGPPADPEFTRIYKKLGGCPSFLMEDVDQAGRIVQLIIKSDSTVRNCSDEIKHRMRRHRLMLISTLPIRRVWLSVKHLRGLGQYSRDHIMNDLSKISPQGSIEDALADAQYVFKPETLARIMFRAVDLEILLRRNPNFGLVMKPSAIEEYGLRIRQEMVAVFEKPGSIRECGITVIENAATDLAKHGPPGREFIGHDSLARFLSDEQLSEIGLRSAIEMGFEKLLEHQLGLPELRELKRVIFQQFYRVDLASRIRT